MSGVSTVLISKGQENLQKWVDGFTAKYGRPPTDNEKQQAWAAYTAQVQKYADMPDESGGEWGDVVGKGLSALVPVAGGIALGIGGATKLDPLNPNAPPSTTGPSGGVGAVPGSGTTPNAAAWNAPGSQGYGAGYVSDATKGLQAKVAQLQAQQHTTQTIQTPAGPQTIQIPVNNPDLDKALAAAQQQLSASQQSDSSAGDTRKLAQNAGDVANRDGPVIRKTRLDLSSAAPNEANAQSARDLQQRQIEALESGASGQGQQAYIDKLKTDLNGGAPSVAELQLRKGMDEARANAASIGNSATGPTRGLAQLEALRSASAIENATNAQAGIQRAQEYATTRDALGSALNQQRTSGIQEQNIASTGLTNMREGDVKILADKYSNAVQQGLISSAEARSQLSAELTQRGLNDTAAEYYTTQYFGQQNRAQDTAIDAEKTRLNTALGVGTQAINRQAVQNTTDANNWNKTTDIIKMGTGAVSAAGSALQQSGVGSSPGASTPSNTNQGPTYVNDTGHSTPIPDDQSDYEEAG